MTKPTKSNRPEIEDDIFATNMLDLCGIPEKTVNGPKRRATKPLETDELAASANIDDDDVSLQCNRIYDERFMDTDPLCNAIYRNDLEDIQDCATACENLHAKTPAGENMLNLAAIFASAEVMEYLLGQGCEFSTNNYGETALHILVTRPLEDWVLDHIEVALAYGCPLNAQDGRGNTALHIACQTSHVGYTDVSLIQLLANAGADLSLRNNGGLLAEEMPRLGVTSREYLREQRLYKNLTVVR